MNTFTGHRSRPSWKTLTALFLAIGLIATAVSLRLAGALDGSTARHRTAIGTVDDVIDSGTDQGTAATSSAAISVIPGTRLTSPDGTPLSTAGGGTYTALCRTDGSGGISVGVTVPGTTGIGAYLPSTGIADPTGLAGLPDCRTLPGQGPSGGTSSGTTDVHCAVQRSMNDLFSEFIKDIIWNNGERWAQELAADGYTGSTTPPASSQEVSEAISKVSASWYDQTSAFYDAFKSLLKDGTTVYADCTDSTSDPDDTAMKTLAEGDDFDQLVEQYFTGVVSLVASDVADAARNGLAPDQSQHTGNAVSR